MTDRMRSLPAAMAVALLLLAAASPASAFSSVTEGDSAHDDITEAAAEAGWPEDAIEALQAAVRQPDRDDLRKVEDEDGEERTDVSITHRPWHHCVREPGDRDDEAFNATAAYVDGQRALAENLSLLDPTAAVRALGRALHALQDCFSHSNVVDLDVAAQAQLTRSLLAGGPPPPGLRVGGIAPGTADIERPAGDDYPHADHSKDDAEASPEAKLVLPDGRTKFEAARDLAKGATREFLVGFMGRLDADETTRLLEVDEGGVGVDELEEADREGRFGIPSSGVLVLPALALAALLRRRRG